MNVKNRMKKLIKYTLLVIAFTLAVYFVYLIHCLSVDLTKPELSSLISSIKTALYLNISYCYFVVITFEKMDSLKKPIKKHEDRQNMKKVYR